MTEKKWLGKGKIGKYDIINFSICLSDIEKNDIHISESNNKKYISLSIGSMREMDKYGKTHNVWVNDYKPEKQPENKPPEPDDLPF